MVVCGFLIMVESGVSVGVSIPCYFYKHHTFDNRLGGLKFPNAIANNFLNNWVMKKQAKESHIVYGGGGSNTNSALMFHRLPYRLFSLFLSLQFRSDLSQTTVGSVSY